MSENSESLVQVLRYRVRGLSLSVGSTTLAVISAVAGIEEVMD
jgi:hypothetical protein